MPIYIKILFRAKKCREEGDKEERRDFNPKMEE
jgi:hypothetical protein